MRRWCNFVKGLTGANGTMKVAFGTEGGLFHDRLGIPTVICGPGSMAQGHKPDEWVSVEQIAALRGDAGGAARPAGGGAVRGKCTMHGAYDFHMTFMHTIFGPCR